MYVYFTHLSLVLSVRYGLITTSRYRLITASRTLQAKGEMCTLQTRKLCYNAINISGGSRGGTRGASGPSFLRPKWGPKGRKKILGDPPLSEGLDPPLNISYVLVLVYMQNCKRAQSLVCHGPS